MRSGACARRQPDCLVARRLQGAVGASDTIARLGGDEFVVRAGAVATKDDAVSVANALQTAISSPSGWRGGSLHQRLIGVAHSSDGYDWPEDMLRDSNSPCTTPRRAAARKPFPSRPECGPRRSPSLISRRTSGARSIEELAVHYQPIVDLGRDGSAGLKLCFAGSIRSVSFRLRVHTAR